MLRLSFSGCGFLLPFHVGVTSALHARGLLARQPESAGLQFAGASGGAIMAATLACGLTPDDTWSAGLDMVHRARHAGVWGRVEGPLRQALEKHLPEDAGERATGVCGLAVTPLAHPMLQLAKGAPELVTTFRDKHDLIDALVASSYVPFYLNSGPTTLFRDEPCVDGGFQQPLPRLDGFVGVTMFPLIPRANDIAPRLLRGTATEGWNPSLPALLHSAFFPGSDTDLMQLRDWGERTAEAWLALPAQRGLVSRSTPTPP